MKVKKFFPRFAQTDQFYAPLCTAFSSADNYRSKTDSYHPAHYVPPPD